MTSNQQIYRLHYRAQLRTNINIEQINTVVEQCKENIRRLQREGLILTAALYYHNQMLFLYYEAIGEALEVIEPIYNLNGVQELGEYLQTTCVHPSDFLEFLSPFLCEWPGQEKARLWVYMYHIYYHSKPTIIETWKRTCIPELRRGRIAFLRADKHLRRW